jgi:hypothetical protein
MLASWASVEAKSLHPDYQLMRGEVQQYGDWLVGCDDNADCTIFGFPQEQMNAALEDGEPILPEMSVRISYSGSEGTLPVVEMFPVVRTAEACARCIAKSLRFRLSASGKLSETLYGFAHVMPAQSEADFVLHAYEKGLRLVGVDEETGQPAIRFPDRRFKAAFRVMRARQTEQLKKLADDAIENLPGELPDGSTMPVAGRLKRIPAIETMVSGFVPILAEGRCRNDFMQNPRQYHFANGAILWSFECNRDVGSTRTLWDMAPNANAIAAPVDLPEPREGRIRAGVDGLERVVFDWDFGILRSYQYLNGREDCGAFRAWGYTQYGWHLLERREMPLCKGLSPNEWIRTHYTPTDGAGPDE